MNHPRAAASHELPDVAFVHDVVVGVVSLTEERHSPDSLALPLGLSLWMRRYGVDLRGTTDALLAARRALLAVSGLDPATEPVPLVVADPRTAVLSLAVYVASLARRAAGALGTSPVDAARRSLSSLGAG